ncbi:MAG: V-type ATP synthase subunit F [Clostridiales bacterium]|jgi:V/A-type H+-transporting ATPase subunit F|nr:V-type ATP synthase subunit F [Clostridiales bacterium]
MKIFLISDNRDTLTGMRLTGIKGAIAHDETSFKKEFFQAVSDTEIALIIITEKISRNFDNIIREFKLSAKSPLIVEIPDRHGLGRSPDFLTKYINEAIGIKI